MTIAYWMLLSLGACSLFGGADEPEEHHEEEEGHEGHGDEVELDEVALANARLVVAPITPERLGGIATVPARVALDPRREARVSAVAAGTVERIHVRPGDEVRAGSPLATVLSPDLGDALGDHLAAAAKAETARAHRDRIAGLHQDGFSSKSQVLEAESELTAAAAAAEAAEERLRVFGVEPEKVRPAQGEHFSSRFPVRSPIDGEVLSIDATLGKSVSGGEPLLHIGNLDEVWVLLDVYETSLASVQPGASVSFTVSAYGAETFTGTVDQVGGWLDPDSRTTEVRVVVPNPDHRLKPNMFAEAQLALASSSGDQGLVVPADAVQEVEGRPSVFVEESAGRFAVRPVRTELMPDGRLHVLSGIEPGARVVTEGAFTLKSELAKSELGEGHAH